jgi:hypothetical protein
LKSLLKPTVKLTDAPGARLPTGAVALDGAEENVVQVIRRLNLLWAVTIKGRRVLIGTSTNLRRSERRVCQDETRLRIRRR